MKRIKYKTIGILMIAIFSLSMIAMNTKEELTTNANAKATNGQKIGWGIKRNDNHEQPDCRK